MKSSLKKLRGFYFTKSSNSDLKAEKRENPNPTHQDELIQASKDMIEMKDCYDNLLSAAAATANSAYEFSEALRELGTCLLEKNALNDDEENGKVLLMLGNVQFELQKLVDSYRIHIIQTITTPSESLLKELQTVEEMKRQCDDKRDVYKFMLAAQREKGKRRNTKSESFSSQQLQAAKEDFEEEANLFVFRLKSLKQGQSHSILTQAARHHAAQLNFFRKGVNSLEFVEPHVRVVAEQQHIDYQFRGLEDDYTEDDDDNGYDYDGNVDGELSFDYGQNDQGQEVVSLSRNSMELDPVDSTNASSTAEHSQENLSKSQMDFVIFNRKRRVISQSAPILADKVEATEKINITQPSPTRKSYTYALPTPADMKRSPPPSVPNKPAKDIKNEKPSPTRIPKPQSVLKESNINSGPIKLPLPMPSPRISELHELPRPPSLVGHSAPLGSMAATKRPAQRASPLPTPPVLMARSFSIPSSGQRTPRFTDSQLLQIPRNHHTDEGGSSPPLTPISLTSSQLASQAVIRAASPNGWKSFFAGHKDFGEKINAMTREANLYKTE